MNKVYLRQDHLGQKTADLIRKDGFYRYVMLETGEIELLDSEVIEIPDWIIDQFEKVDIEITDEALRSYATYVHLDHLEKEGDCVELDGGFSLQTLKAIIWWMENIK